MKIVLAFLILAFSHTSLASASECASNGLRSEFWPLMKSVDQVWNLGKSKGSEIRVVSAFREVPNRSPQIGDYQAFYMTIKSPNRWGHYYSRINELLLNGLRFEILSIDTESGSITVDDQPISVITRVILKYKNERNQTWLHTYSLDYSTEGALCGPKPFDSKLL